MGDRHSIRATWYDYNGGLFFVTICAYKMRQIFGVIADAKMHLTPLGEIAQACVERIPQHYNCELRNYVIMPNHIHMVLMIPYNVSAEAPKATETGALKSSKHGIAVDDFHHNCKLSVIVGTFKAAVTRSVKQRTLPNSSTTLPPTFPIWHSRYHEHIIRSKHSLAEIMQYIDYNILKWDADRFNPNNSSDKSL